MEFLGVGYQEVAVIMVLLLVVVGPERMPAVAYQVGKAVRQMQRYARAVRDEFSDEIDFLEEQYRTVKGETDQLSQTLRAGQADLNAQLRETMAPLHLAAPTLDLPLLTAPEASVAEASPAAEATAAPAGEAPTKAPLLF